MTVKVSQLQPRKQWPASERGGRARQHVCRITMFEVQRLLCYTLLPSAYETAPETVGRKTYSGLLH